MRRYTQKEGKCWRWIGGRGGNGYGRITLAGVRILAHRATYAVFVAAVPARVLVLHDCDHKWCVRPSHLHLGDNDQNMREAKERNRFATGDRHGSKTRPDRVPDGTQTIWYRDPESVRGARNPQAKLGECEVREILRQAAAGRGTREISRAFSVCEATVSMIRHGKRWAHLRGEVAA